MARLDIESLRWWKPVRQSFYPHFNSQDFLIWDSFMSSEASKFSRFSYDVPLVEESLSNPSHPDYLTSDWNYLTAYKIDAIGCRPNGLYLFEVKPILGHQAIGQIQAYASMFTDVYSNFNPLVKNIVCLSAPAPLVKVCKDLQINVYNVVG